MMAFQTPPVFVDGEILSASQLNVLAANQNYLSGLASSVNPPFAQITLNDEGDSRYYDLIHQHDWLYLRVSGAGAVRIYSSLDGFSHAMATVAGSAGEAMVSIAAAGIPKGGWVRWRLRGGDDPVSVHYFAEAAND
jgi:hypothetical protein